MKILESVVSSPLGDLVVVTREDGALLAVYFQDRASSVHAHLGRHLPGLARVGEVPETVQSAFASYFSGQLRALEPLPIDIVGSEFQKRVLESVRGIRPGQTASYAALARGLGDPQASQAVGAANGANPLLLVIPCHRVLGSSGELRGYAGGLERKRWLLRHEGVLWEQPTLLA